MGKWFHPTVYRACDYVSMLVLKLIQVNKRGPWFPLFPKSLKHGKSTSVHVDCPNQCWSRSLTSGLITRTLFSWRSLRWRHNGRDGVSNHHPHLCLLNRLFRCRSKKTSNLRVTGLCAGNSPETSEFPAQMASNAENVSIWWRHHVLVEMDE